jgi:hypothetical protein
MELGMFDESEGESNEGEGNDEGNGPVLTIEQKRAMSRVIYQYCEIYGLHDVYIEFANHPDSLEDSDLIDFSDAFFEAYYVLIQQGTLLPNADPDWPTMDQMSGRW